jgi:dTDP-4-dehydrorhamnose 3,5-epimerase-like enzyme
MTRPDAAAAKPDHAEGQSFFAGKARMIALPTVADARGKLVALEFSELPFIPRRVYIVQDAPAGALRGGHAHRQGQELLICLAGRVAVRLSLKGEEKTVLLDSAARGLLIEAGIWAEQKYLEPGTTLCVFSSEPYDPENYLSDAV